jgi:hypothetical protein
MSVWSKAMFCAAILITVPAGAPLGAADAPPLGDGAIDAPVDALGCALGCELGGANASFQQLGTGVAEGGWTKLGSRQPEICAGYPVAGSMPVNFRSFGARSHAMMSLTC